MTANSERELIKTALDNLSENQVKSIYNTYVKNIKKSSTTTPIRVIDTTTDKYKLLLEFANKILKNINKDQIYDLTEFKNIDRLDIVREENKVILDKMANRLFKHYDKYKCGYYRKSPNIVFNCMRNMCKDIGLNMTKKRRNKIKEGIVKTHYFYSINI